MTPLAMKTRLMVKPPKMMEHAIYTSGSEGSSDTSAVGALADRVLLANQPGLMAIQLGLSETAERGIGLRHDTGRRLNARRVRARGTAERRRAVRRRRRWRSLLFTSLALALPHQLKHAHTTSRLPRVSTRIDSMIAASPAQAYEGFIREAAALYQVDASLIRSIMQAESSFDPSAVSRAGAMGLMQLMPDMAEAFGVEHPFDPRENIMAGTRLLRELLDQHHGDVKLAVASYNAGPTAVANYGGVPPFRETLGYVKKVTGLIADARRAGDND
jgi:soluble lytic murein transglycosylase-like protein